MESSEIIIDHYQYSEDLIGDLVITYRTVGKGFYIETAILKNLTQTPYVTRHNMGIFVVARKTHPDLIEMVKFELND